MAPKAGRHHNGGGSLWLLLGLLAATLGCQRTEGAMSMERPPALVSVTTAIAKDVPVYLEEIGRCAAREMVSIQPQVSGRITQIHFTDGADLKTGDPLFTIDPRPYQAQLNLAKANLAESNAALNLAKLEWDRASQLMPDNAISGQEYDQLKNAVAVAEAKVKSSEAAVETATLNLEYCSIRSPIDGRAGQRLVDLGNVVTASGLGGTGSLLVIHRLDPIYADFTIPENDLSRVQENRNRGTLKVEVWLPDAPSDTRTGELTFLDNTVQDGTGTVKLRATLPNADHHFWPGRFVKVRLILSVHKNAVLIPAGAPQVSAKGPFVYVVKEDSTAELRPVTLGQRYGDLVLIAQGLKPDERVITLGQMAVAPGGKVQVEEAKPPADKASGGHR
jgi:multidrug efflux system membrane fusion protein